MNEETRLLYESLGIDGVLAEIASGKFGPGKSVSKNEAETWVTAERAKLEVTFAARTEAREEVMISIAKATSDSARLAARWAVWAVIIAVIATITTNKDQILSLIFGSP